MSRSRRSIPKTVLVIEPEPGIRKLIGETLEINGYHVLMAHDVAEAMAASGRHQGPVALIVVDLLLPDVADDSVVPHLGPLCASAKVLYLTDQKAGSRRAPRLLRMPFTVNMLLHKVFEALGDRRLAKLPAEPPPSPPAPKGRRSNLRVIVGGYEPPHGEPRRAK
jgi:DNA-binding NtrC family response regulator